MQLSQNKKTLSQFFLHLGNLESILNNLKKKMTLIADVFLKVCTLKKVAR